MKESVNWDSNIDAERHSIIKVEVYFDRVHWHTTFPLYSIM